MTDSDLPRPSEEWPDALMWWDVIRSALADDPNDARLHREMLRANRVGLTYGDAEAVAALKDVWDERDAMANCMDALRAMADAWVMGDLAGAVPIPNRADEAGAMILALLNGEAPKEWTGRG